MVQFKRFQNRSGSCRRRAYRWYTGVLFDIWIDIILNIPQLMLFPGVITTGLESWSTDADSLGFFRQRIWGTHTWVSCFCLRLSLTQWSMFKSIFADKNEWIRQISLDRLVLSFYKWFITDILSETGLDPPGVRVRPAQGLDAASMFMQGWVLIIYLVKHDLIHVKILGLETYYRESRLHKLWVLNCFIILSLRKFRWHK